MKNRFEKNFSLLSTVIAGLLLAGAAQAGDVDPLHHACITHTAPAKAAGWNVAGVGTTYAFGTLPATAHVPGVGLSVNQPSSHTDVWTFTCPADADPELAGVQPPNAFEVRIRGRGEDPAGAPVDGTPYATSNTNKVSAQAYHSTKKAVNATDYAATVGVNGAVTEYSPSAFVKRAAGSTDNTYVVLVDKGVTSEPVAGQEPTQTSVQRHYEMCIACYADADADPESDRHAPPTTGVLNQNNQSYGAAAD